MRVTNQVTRHLAALRKSQSLPPLTRAWLSLITLTLRRLGLRGSKGRGGGGTARRLQRAEARLGKLALSALGAARRPSSSSC